MNPGGEAPLLYLGTHEVHWLEKIDLPLCLSDVRLRVRKRLPRARARWVCDSGGFSELKERGHWTVTPEEYVRQVRRYRQEIGLMDWAAIQDWMCEEIILQKTGLRVQDHLQRTVESYLRLRDLAPEIPWLPVLQGFTLGHYLDCAELYARHGVDLTQLPLVGVGSICRRQNTHAAVRILMHLAMDGIRIHGFGFKITGLLAAHEYLKTADTLAWSTSARKNPGVLGHTHKSCNSCPEYALLWRDELIARLEGKIRRGE